MTDLPILHHGSCEPLKATVHGAALGLAALMGLYNAAAWLRRRERHLAVNTVLYSLAIAWEQRHVAHHLAACRGTSQGRERVTLTLVKSDTDASCDILKVA